MARAVSVGGTRLRPFWPAEGVRGAGAVPNTSFNLHGEPIVYSPADAIDVFVCSGLTHLALDHFLVSKRPGDGGGGGERPEG